MYYLSFNYSKGFRFLPNLSHTLSYLSFGTGLLTGSVPFFCPESNKKVAYFLVRNYYHPRIFPFLFVF